MTVVEDVGSLPFKVKRVYYLCDVPSGEKRGGHAHRELSQLIIAAAGSFEVLLDDGKHQETVVLSRPDYGLLIVPGIWRELMRFSSGAICLVLASMVYDETDYIRDYKKFIESKA